MQAPGAQAALQSAVGRAIEKLGRKGGTASYLFESGDYTCSYEEYLAALRQLEASGTVAVWNRRIYAIRFTDWVVGQMQLTKGRGGLIRSGAAGEVGYQVRRPQLKGALSGDTVLARPIRKKGSGGRERLPQAIVIKILRRGLRTVVGKFQSSDLSRRFVPFDPKVDLHLRVEGADEVEDDCYVVVDIDYAASPRTGQIRGRIVETLGRVVEPGVDTSVVLRHFAIPDQFPKDVRTAAGTFQANPDQNAIAGREDLRDLVTVTIDGESARDFDDAISIAPTPDGGYSLGVHIADVSHYVESDSLLDFEAYRRGTSVYFADRAVPMLPESLSTGL